MDLRRMRFEAQVMPHFDAAYRFARWLARSENDADDVVQEAVLRAWRGFEGLRGGDVRSWLFTIVRNCHATAHRQEKRRGAVPLPEESDTQDGHAMASEHPGPENLAQLRDDERHFQGLLGALSQEHREVLELRELEEMSYQEIASVIRVPIGTVMSRLARAREALKQLWLRDSRGELRGMS